MVNRVFMIHGWGGTPESDWFIWVKKELEKKGFEVIAPLMPDTKYPKIKSWINFLRQEVGKVDENTYFIGHSIGCQAIMRYIENLNPNERVGGVIFVAGWFNLTDETWDEDYTKEIAMPWIETLINFNKIKKHTSKFIDIYSDNYPYVPLTDSKIFKDKFNAKLVVLKNKGHIAGEDGVKEFPILLNEFLNLVRW